MADFEPIILKKGPMLGNDLSQYQRFVSRVLRPDSSESRGCLCVPLTAKGGVQGIACLFDDMEKTFGEDQMAFFEALGRQVGVAMHNAQLYDQLRSQHERLQTLSRRVVEVQESERRYIAQELHDEAAQTLTSLLVGLRLLDKQANCPEAVHQRVTALTSLTNGVMENLHDIAEDLRPAGLRQLGLAAALRAYVESF